MPELPDITPYLDALGERIVGRRDAPAVDIASARSRRRRYFRGRDRAPRCQTEGRVLADGTLSRLLKDDWPKTADELERLQVRSRTLPRPVG